MGSGLVQKCAVLSAASADRGRITFSPKTNGTRVCLEHTETTSSIRSLYACFVNLWCAPECTRCIHTRCIHTRCIHTCTNQPHQMEEMHSSLIQPNWTGLVWKRCKWSYKQWCSPVYCSWYTLIFWPPISNTLFIKATTCQFIISNTRF